MPTNRLIHVYLGSVFVEANHERIRHRRAAGDTDASEDMLATFLPERIVAAHRTEELVLQTLAGEIRSIADSIRAAARKLGKR